MIKAETTKSPKKFALVTGGTSGVGRSILPDLVDAGFYVYFMGTNSEKGQAVESELNVRGQVSEFVPLDLSSLKDVRAFAEKFRDDVPKLDLLLNVAGAMFPERQLTPEGFEKTFAIGYLSAFILCRELTPSLAAAQHGRIANVAGVPRFVLEPVLDFDDLSFETNYQGMRVAIRTIHAKSVLTEILAEKLRESGVDVNSFHPGAIKGDLGRNMSFPMNFIFGLANSFMARTSKSGIYVSLSDEVQGVTGQLFVGKKPRPLHFDQSYKDGLWEKTESLLAGY
jgi:NAD(P)-dependent dehydrogenase (short-subunit alcohol dehydrogenase family)